MNDTVESEHTNTAGSPVPVVEGVDRQPDAQPVPVLDRERTDGERDAQDPNDNKVSDPAGANAGA